MQKWTVQDLYGNPIYLTDERWQHILEARPEMEPFFEQFLETIHAGRRKQEGLIPNEYRYFKQFDELLPDNNHLVAKVSMMNTIRQQTTTLSANGETIRMSYDESADILEVFFGENAPATGVELTDHLLLRLNRDTGRAVSLTMLHFSILIERTEYGPRSYPLDRLAEMPEDLRDLVLRIVTTTPVNQFLNVSHFQASRTKQIPLTSIEPLRFASAA